jgi:hypothetical protein
VMARAPRFDWGAAGFTDDGPSLDEEAADAVEYVEGVTWRKLDATMPDAYARRAAKAVVMRTQQQVVQGDPDMVETGADELTSNSSAGGASESRRGFNDYEAANKALLVNRWPALNDLLWQVMTPEAQAWWRAFLTGEMPAVPAAYLEGGFNVVEVAWGAMSYSPYAGNAPSWLLSPDANDLPTDPHAYGGDDPLPNW